MKVLVSIGVVILFGTFLAISYITAHNKGVRLEESILAQYQENQNQLSNLTNQVLESAQVPSMMKEDLTEIIRASMEGRYGPEGVKALLVSVQENYPGQLDASLYTNIQNMIEAGRNSFRVEQSKLIDKTRIYKVELGSFWSGMWLRMAGYPTAGWDWKQFEPILAERVQEVYETGIDKGMKLR